MREYYAERAPHYDSLYARPERQADLMVVQDQLKGLFSRKKVLEIACGTGYWTQAIAQTAEHILATDINEPMLEIARQKEYPAGKVDFQCIDMYQLTPGNDDALFGGFIWSHIPLEQIGNWLDHLNGLIGKGGRAVFVDNLFVPGSSTEIAHTDANGNTFQKRLLPDGSSHLIIKNFPQMADFEKILKNKTKNWALTAYSHYWVLDYETV
ncbi:MAG: methyltransferase domain-containing protein [Saprospiraceae bacterium]|nr:methyltransferase domain-containing protein [Saprospiraceae bacterium]